MAFTEEQNQLDNFCILQVLTILTIELRSKNGKILSQLSQEIKFQSSNFQMANYSIKPRPFSDLLEDNTDFTQLIHYYNSKMILSPTHIKSKQILPLPISLKARKNKKRSRLCLKNNFQNSYNIMKIILLQTKQTSFSETSQ